MQDVPIKPELDKMNNYLIESKQNLNRLTSEIGRLSRLDKRVLLVEPMSRLSELQGRQDFLEQALQQQSGQQIDGGQFGDQFGIVGWAIAGAGLTALALGAQIYKHYAETREFENQMKCYTQLREDGMPSREAAKVCFGGGLLSMLGIDTKTMFMIAGLSLLVYYLISRVNDND